MTFEEIERKLTEQAQENQDTAQRAAYAAGVRDTLQEIKQAGISDPDLSKWDFSELWNEETIKAFERMEQDMNDFKLEINDLKLEW